MSISAGSTNQKVGYLYLKLRLATLLNWHNNPLLTALKEIKNLSGGSNILGNSLIIWLVT